MLRQPLDSPQERHSCEGWSRKDESGCEASSSVSSSRACSHHRHPPRHILIPSHMAMLITIIHIIRLLTMPQTHCPLLSAVVLFLPAPSTIRNSLICFLIKQVLDLQLLGCCVCSVLCVCHCLLLSFNFAFKRFAPSASKGCAVKGSRGQHTAYSESWFRSCCQKCVRSSLHSTFWTADRRTKDRRPCVVIFHFVHNPRPSVALPKFVYVEKSDIPVGKQSVRGRGTGSGGREVLEVEGKGQAASSGSGN